MKKIFKKSSGIGARINMGFGIVIVIMMILGIIATWSMFTVLRQSGILANEHIPQVKGAGNVERSYLKAMYNMVGYAFSQGEKYMGDALKNIQDVKQHIESMDKLIADSPNLSDLKEPFKIVNSNILEYERLVNETIAKNKGIAEDRKALDNAADQYMKNCYELLIDQNETLETEVFAGFPPKSLSERLKKLNLINEVIDLGNATQIATFKAQALINPQLIRVVQPNFDIMQKKLQFLLSQARLDENINRIKKVMEAADKYKSAMNNILLNTVELEDINKVRLAVAEKSVESMQSMAAEGMNETTSIAENTVSRLSRAFWITIIGLIAALGIAFIVATYIKKSITKPIAEAVEANNTLSQGNLTVDIQIKRQDETGLLLAAMKRMVEKLKQVVSDVKAASDSVTTGSRQLAATAEELSQGSAEQSSSAEQASSSMEQMASNIAQNAENAMQTEKIALKAAEDAKQGGKAVDKTVNAMKQISEKISIIEEIARQTDMLALNAAIEAARAGEYGRGFAVVASEVRKLSERTQRAAAEINKLSASSIEIAETAGHTLAQIVPDIQKTSELVQEISAACKEQTTGSDQVNRAIQQLDQVIQQNASASEQMASTSQSLMNQAEQLQHVMAFFKIDTGVSSQIKSYAETSAIEDRRLVAVSSGSERIVHMELDEKPDDHQFDQGKGVKKEVRHDEEFEKY